MADMEFTEILAPAAVALGYTSETRISSGNPAVVVAQAIAGKGFSGTVKYVEISFYAFNLHATAVAGATCYVRKPGGGTWAALAPVITLQSAIGTGMVWTYVPGTENAFPLEVKVELYTSSGALPQFVFGLYNNVNYVGAVRMIGTPA